MKRAETDYGVTKEARIGNPFLYAQRLFILLLNSVFTQERILDYGTVTDDSTVCSESPKNPYRVMCKKDGTIDIEKSKLFITHTFNEEQTAAQPQIVVSRGTSSWTDMFIGDQGKSFGMATTKLAKGYSDKLVVPINFEIYSRNDIEVDELGWIVSGIIKLYEKTIRKSSLVFSISSPVVSAVQMHRADADYKLFRLDISLIVQFAVHWTQRTTLNVEAFNKAVCKLSDTDWPRVVTDICIIANTVD